MEAGIESRPTAAAIIRRAQVLQIKPEAENSASCVLSAGDRVLASNILAAHVQPGDEIDFPVALDSAGTEIYIRKTAPSARSRDVYQAPIGYATQPKSDKRERLYVRAEVLGGRLGISALLLPCEVLRDYFYVGNRRKPRDHQPTLYHVLRTTSTASLAELRLAFKLREAPTAPTAPTRPTPEAEEAGCQLNQIALECQL